MASANAEHVVSPKESHSALSRSSSPPAFHAQRCATPIPSQTKPGPEPDDDNDVAVDKGSSTAASDRGQTSVTEAGAQAEARRVKQRNKRRYRRKDKSERKELAQALPFASLSSLSPQTIMWHSTGSVTDAGESKNDATGGSSGTRRKPDSVNRSIDFFLQLVEEQSINQQVSLPSRYSGPISAAHEAETLHARKFNNLDEMSEHSERLASNLEATKKHIKIWPRCFERAIAKPPSDPDLAKDLVQNLQIGIDILMEMVALFEKQCLILEERVRDTADSYREHQRWNLLWEEQLQLPKMLESLAQAWGRKEIKNRTLDDVEVQHIMKRYAGWDGLKEILANKDESWYTYRAKLGIYRLGITSIGGRDMLAIEVKVQRRRLEIALEALRTSQNSPTFILPLK